MFDTYYTIVDTIFSHNEAQSALEVIESIENDSKTQQYAHYSCVMETLTQLKALKNSYFNHFSVVYPHYLNLDN